MPDFSWTEEQEQYRESVVNFAQRELNDRVVERDAQGEFSRDAWQRCADFGLLGLPIPEEYGGSAADPQTIELAMEALGYGCEDNGLLFSLNAHMWSCEIPILRFGSDDQKRRYLPGLCNGSLIGVQGMTEPESGSDAFSLRTTAEAEGDVYILNGSKTFITNAPVADVFVVFASTDPSQRFAGISAFIVERDSPGLVVGEPFAKMGLRTSPMSELYFDGCRVATEQILGRPGAGMPIFNHSMDWERSFILATAVGAMQRQLETCIDYARQRKQFGQPIGRFQSVSNKIVDMKIRLETARLLMQHLAWAREVGQTTALESAMAKLWVSESFLASSLDSVQIHGGTGYMVETGLERQVRDAVASRIYSGTSEVQRSIIARTLGL
jgi:alkylation response protein AidB-like acyl-CoA dehydrogenase